MDETIAIHLIFRTKEYGSVVRFVIVDTNRCIFSASAGRSCKNKQVTQAY